MDYEKTVKAIGELSLFEIRMLSAEVANLLTDKKKLKQVKQALSSGDIVKYVDNSTGVVTGYASGEGGYIDKQKKMIVFLVNKKWYRNEKETQNYISSVKNENHISFRYSRLCDI